MPVTVSLQGKRTPTGNYEHTDSHLCDVYRPCFSRVELSFPELISQITETLNRKLAEFMTRQWNLKGSTLIDWRLYHKNNNISFLLAHSPASRKDDGSFEDFSTKTTFCPRRGKYVTLGVDIRWQESDIYFGYQNNFFRFYPKGDPNIIEINMQGRNLSFSFFRRSTRECNFLPSETVNSRLLQTYFPHFFFTYLFFLFSSCILCNLFERKVGAMFLDLTWQARWPNG